MKIKIQKLHPAAKIPMSQSKGAVGYDICSLEEVKIEPNETVLVKTGIALEVPIGTVSMLFPRSSLANKRGLILANSVGIIDPDYRGEVMIAFRNIGSDPAVIEKGERCAQFVFLNYLDVQFQEVDKLKGTERGSGGFGSTGTK